MKTIKILILFIFCLGLQKLTYAQVPVGGLKSPKVLTVPKAYLEPTGILVSENAVRALNNGPNSKWVVFSDRDKNATSRTPGGTDTYKEIDFMDPFYVVAHEGYYLRIVKYEPTKLVSKGKRINFPEDYGWIHQNKLLSWRFALRNPKNNFEIKALTVHRLKDLNSIGRSIGKQMKFYNSPNLEKDFENDKDVRLYQFLFVLKRMDNSTLIAKTDEIGTSEASIDVMGWVSDSVLYNWNTRIAREPNWDEDAAEERKTMGKKTKLFNSKESAARYKGSGRTDIENLLWDEDPYELRKSPYWKRLPVLEQYPTGVFRTGVVSPVFDVNGNESIDAEAYNQVEKEYNKVRDKFRQVNIVFVVDGTPSMQPYLTPIINSIRAGSQVWQESKNKYKMGAVVYFDKGQQQVKKKNLTNGYESVLQFIASSKSDIPSYEDVSTDTDMYAGLDRAVRMLKPGETNIVVLVGDAENLSEKEIGEIAQKIKRVETSMLIFQARSTADLPYLNFISHAKELILNSADFGGQRPRLRKSNAKENTFELSYPNESPIPGSLVHAELGGSFSQDMLEKEIRSIVNKLESNHKRTIEALDAKMLTLGPKEVYVNEGMRHIIKKMKVSKDILRKVQENNYQLFVEAYGSVDTDYMEYPLYNSVLFMSEKELYKMMLIIEQVFDPNASYSEIRKGIIDNYKQVLISHFGDNKKTSRAVRKKTPSQVFELVTGLPSKSNLLTNFTIDALASKNIVKDQQLVEINNYLREKHERISKIAGNPAYSFRSLDVTYYWVPQEFLP